MQPSIECKLYQRHWRDWAVDQNLKDVWLENLNSLETLDLVSICEGHIDAKPTSIRRSPSIILSLQKAYVRPLTEQWYGIKKTLADVVGKIWQNEDTTIEFEMQHGINRNGRVVEYSDDIIFRVVSSRKRDTARFLEWANQWFPQSVFRIETFDRFMKNFVTINAEKQ